MLAQRHELVPSTRGYYYIPIADLWITSMVTACIVLLYISYAIPVVCLLIRGRNNIAHGPFWMGPIGLFSNCVLLVWTLFTFIMYSFPAVQPVLPNSKPPVPELHSKTLSVQI